LTEWKGRPASVSWPENAFRRLGTANFITPVDRNSSPSEARHNPTALLQLVCRMRLTRAHMRDAPNFVCPCCMLLFIFQSLQEFIDAVESGDIRVTIDRTFKLNKIVEAHKYMESNQAIGKIVVGI